MKINQLLERREIPNSSGTNLTDAQFQVAFDAVKREELDKAEISDLARQLEEDERYGRSKDSAEFVLTRMHILVHGMAPHGETERRAETMFTIPKTMIEFANRNGIDTYENIDRARAELKNRPVKVKYDVAKKLMSDYYMKNKASLPKSVVNYREEIIQQIMNGAAPELAFKNVL